MGNACYQSLVIDYRDTSNIRKKISLSGEQHPWVQELTNEHVQSAVAAMRALRHIPDLYRLYDLRLVSSKGIELRPTAN